MPARYSIAEARAQIPALVDLAESGREIELTRRGKPVAVVLSTQELKRLRVPKRDFPTAYQNFVRKFTVKTAAVGQDFALSLRDQSTGR